MADKDYREIEVRFLEVDKEKLIKKLTELGAEDKGENLLKEVIFYDKFLKWQYKEKKFVRIRQTKEGIFLAFKHNQESTSEGTKEVEFQIDNFEKAKQFLKEVGLREYRQQEKKRHKFILNNVIVDIDTWPTVPTYVELEGSSEKDLKKVAKLLNLDWLNVVFEAPRYIIETRYNIPFSKLKKFTFSKIE